MIADVTETVSQSYEPDTHPTNVEAPRLIIAVHCAAPTSAGSRVGLGRVEEVVVGRHPVLAIDRRGDRIEIGLPDSEASRKHARLRRHSGGWDLTDLESKNGTLVNGSPVRTATLVDGDVVEIGSTMFVYRDEAMGVQEVGDRELVDDQGPRAFRTLELQL
jgi:pSer/pThr/pTyr-binding forkhead associated (FHA) protein